MKFGIMLTVALAFIAAAMAPNTGVANASGYCVDTMFAGDASPKLNQHAQGPYTTAATIVFDSNCRPALTLTPGAVANGAVTIDTGASWSTVQTSVDTWKATLRAAGPWATVTVGGNDINMRPNSVVIFKVTAGGDLWFKASGVAYIGMAPIGFETQSAGLGLAPQ